jgi:hypothetical protein
MGSRVAACVILSREDGEGSPDATECGQASEGSPWRSHVPHIHPRKSVPRAKGLQWRTLYGRACLLLLLFLSAVTARGAITIGDLEGDWLSDRYAAMLVKSRSPMQAEKVGVPVTFSVQRTADGWRLLNGNFHEQTWQTIVALQHVNGSSYDLVVGEMEVLVPEKTVTIRLSISSKGSGRPSRIYGVVWPYTRASYQRLNFPLQQFVSRALLAGRYRDDDGGTWSLSDTGEASSPDDASYRWRPVLDISEACCDYFEVTRTAHPEDPERVGFAWHEGKLRLYHIAKPKSEEDCPIACAKRPFAVLTPLP